MSPQLYPPPSTLPPPSVATRGERDMVGNVGFDKFHQPRSSGTAIDQNECFERHKRIAYGRQGVMIGSAHHQPAPFFFFTFVLCIYFFLRGPGLLYPSIPTWIPTWTIRRKSNIHVDRLLSFSTPIVIMPPIAVLWFVRLPPWGPPVIVNIA